MNEYARHCSVAILRYCGIELVISSILQHVHGHVAALWLFREQRALRKRDALEPESPHLIETRGGGTPSEEYGAYDGECFVRAPSPPPAQKNVRLGTAISVVGSTPASELECAAQTPTRTEAHETRNRDEHDATQAHAGVNILGKREHARTA